MSRVVLALKLPWVMAVVAALLLALVPSPSQARDERPDEEIAEKLERLLNYPREGRGLPRLHVHVDTRADAADWSRRMAHEGRLSHDPSLGSRMPPGAGMWAEVVGRTTSPEDAALVIRNAWFRSEAHRQILLDPRFTHVGVGMAKGGPYNYATARLWG